MKKLGGSILTCHTLKFLSDNLKIKRKKVISIIFSRGDKKKKKIKRKRLNRNYVIVCLSHNLFIYSYWKEYWVLVENFHLYELKKKIKRANFFFMMSIVNVTHTLVISRSKFFTNIISFLFYFIYFNNNINITLCVCNF
jgi:hypothetical protein